MLHVYALEMDQDDPIKCTARKMIHMELAKGVGRKYHASDTTIVLNPFAHRMLSPPDRDAKGILVVDCSWNQAQEIFFKKLGENTGASRSFWRPTRQTTRGRGC